MIAAPASPDRHEKWLQATLFAAILLCLALQAWLIFVREFNWDEYFYLSHVHEYLRGEPSGALQRGHVHLFAWLAHVGDEHDQLIAGRLVMLGCQTISCFSLYLIARAWTGRLAALVAVLAYASAGMTLLHGMSFRADPLAEAIVMGALAIVARADWKPATMFLVAALLGASALVTIKVIFFAPAFLAIGAWRMMTSGRSRAMLLSGLFCAVLTIICFAAFYWIHQASLPDANLVQSEAALNRAVSKTLGESGFFPRRADIIAAAVGAPVQSALLVLALPFLLPALFDHRRRWEALAVLGCVAPLLSLIVYRNAFPYFFPFITVSACVSIAWLVDRRRWNPAMVAVLAVAMLATGLASVWRARAMGQDTQRRVISAVHQIFPEPVTVIDRNHMVATFPRRGFFMSTWGLEDYRIRGPFVEEALAREPVPLLLLNSPSLQHAVGAALTMPLAYPLLDADRRTLSENYIPHWGPIWVAGKRLAPASEESIFHIAVPGLYTLEGGELTIDDKRIPSGGTVRLSRGEHQLRAASPVPRLLRWGKHLPRPTEAPPSEPIFRGF